MPDFDVVMIGNFAKDKLIVDGVEEIASGGGVYYGSVVVSRLGGRVMVITRLHPDDFHRLEELKAEGVIVHATAAEGTSGIANYYQSSDMETRICKPIGYGGQYQIEDIPPFTTKIIMLSPLFAGEVDLELLQTLAKKAPIAMDIQGFVRVPIKDDLIFQPWSQMRTGLENITYLKLDRAEALFITGEENIQKAAVKLTEMGPKEIVLTQSSGVTVFADGHFYSAPFTPRSLAGRTGRGDTCFATYLTKRLKENAQVACQWAAVVTSMKQEIPGPWRGSAAEVEEKLEQQVN